MEFRGPGHLVRGMGRRPWGTILNLDHNSYLQLNGHSMKYAPLCF